MDVTAVTLRDELARGEKVVLVDVREDWEVELCRIPGSLHVPLAELPGRMAELEPGARVVAICHKGARSLQAARYLQANGFAGARSLQGGVDAWAVNVDPAIARY